MDSYTELLKSFEYIPRNFRLTRNIPIDTRFLVENLKNIDTVIPKALRYPGLIFFVKESNINDGTTKNLDGTKHLGSTDDNTTTKIIGTLYYFDENLEPIALHDSITRFEIRLLNIDTDKYNYSNLIDTTEESNKENSLNHIFAKIGNIVFIEPLGIAVICRLNKDNAIYWQYFAGTYNCTEKEFESIPESLKQPNTIVNLINDDKSVTKKIITSEGELSDEIIKTESTKNCTENGRFYNINGFIYYHFGNLTIPVSNKFCTRIKSLEIGDNIINLGIDPDSNNETIFDSNFYTDNIIVDCIIPKSSLEAENYPDTICNKYGDKRFPIEHKIIENTEVDKRGNKLKSNAINIISSIAIKDAILIIRAYE